MNVFFLDPNPKQAAEYHCDKHVVKMILEYAQLLSTAHRVLDGKEDIEFRSSRKVKVWRLDDDRNHALYRATHINHPSAVWVRKSIHNYNWLYSLFTNLCNEYTLRYNRIHLCETKLRQPLLLSPKRIGDSPFTEPPPAMPDYCKVSGSSVDSYRKYYIKEKVGFAKWTKRNPPAWFTTSQKDK